MDNGLILSYLRILKKFHSHYFPGEKKDVDMMSETEKMDYMKHDLFQAVIKEYGESNYDAIIVLPTDKSREAYKTILAEIGKNPSLIARRKFRDTKVVFSVPKFKTEYEIGLNDILKYHGMNKAFNYSAELGNLLEEKKELYVSNVNHKTFMEFDENGTKAAAVTSITITEKSAKRNDPIVMLVDRPFFIFIRHRDTGTILFSGLIQNIE